MSSLVYFVERSANPLLQITMHHNCAGHCRGDRHEVHWSMRPKWLDSGAPIEAILSTRLSAVTR